MPFRVHLTDADRAYLANCPISDGAKDKLREFIEVHLPNVTDDFRKHPANRPQSGPYFRIDHILLDASDKSAHAFRFIVRDDRADEGDLLVVYVTHLPAGA